MDHHHLTHHYSSIPVGDRDYLSVQRCSCGASRASASHHGKNFHTDWTGPEMEITPATPAPAPAPAPATEAAKTTPAPEAAKLPAPRGRGRRPAAPPPPPAAPPAAPEPARQGRHPLGQLWSLPKTPPATPAKPETPPATPAPALTPAERRRARQAESDAEVMARLDAWEKAVAKPAPAPAKPAPAPATPATPATPAAKPAAAKPAAARHLAIAPAAPVVALRTARKARPGERCTGHRSGQHRIDLDEVELLEVWEPRARAEHGTTVLEVEGSCTRCGEVCRAEVRVPLDVWRWDDEDEGDEDEGDEDEGDEDEGDE